MAEAPVSKDSLIGHQNPLEFVQGEEATKDSLLRTFAEQRKFYKGAVDTDAERFLKTRPTHKLIATTFYGKNITQSGTSVRYNHVRGQADLINRPMHLTKFRPIENLSSKTYAPNGDGGEVPLNYENTNGLDPRAVSITDEPRYDVGAIPEQYNFNTVGGYPGRDVDSYMFDFAEQNPTFSSLFYQFKPRM